MKVSFTIWLYKFKKKTKKKGWSGNSIALQAMTTSAHKPLANDHKPPEMTTNHNQKYGNKNKTK